MRTRRTWMMMLPVVFVVLVAVAAVPSARAQERSPASRQGGSPDFLFGRPAVWVGVRGALTLGRAGSDWYDFVTDQLTLDRSDFQAAGIAFDLGVAVTPRLEIVFGADFAGVETPSEFRHWVDNNRLPITQTTRLRQASLTGGVRWALTDRGRELSALAWIPRRLVPYAGGGGGGIWYRVRQSGDFIDQRDLSVFTDVLESAGWAPAGYVHGGVDLHVVRHFYISFDARYLWAAPELEAPWIGFEPLDLAGLRLSTGISLAF